MKFFKEEKKSLQIRIPVCIILQLEDPLKHDEEQS